MAMLAGTKGIPNLSGGPSVSRRSDPRRSARTKGNRMTQPRVSAATVPSRIPMTPIPAPMASAMPKPIPMAPTTTVVRANAIGRNSLRITCASIRDSWAGTRISKAHDEQGPEV